MTYKARVISCFESHTKHVNSVLEVCHLRCVFVRTGKGMQSNTTLSIKMFNDYIRQLHVSVPTGHLHVVFKRT